MYSLLVMQMYSSFLKKKWRTVSQHKNIHLTKSHLTDIGLETARETGLT